MKHPSSLLLSSLLPLSVLAQTAPPPLPQLGAAECEVWVREASFAKSVEDRDPAAFASHLDEGAVFGAKSPQPQRGRDAIVAAWGGIIDGSALELRWYPTMVAIDGSGQLAYSSGPALYARAGEAGPDYRMGAFQSIWRRGGDGAWRVVFDDGIRPQPATAEQVEAFRKGQGAPCPRDPTLTQE